MRTSVCIPGNYVQRDYSGKGTFGFSPFCERLGTAEVIPEIILLGLRQCVGGLGTAGVILGNVPLGFHLSVND